MTKKLLAIIVIVIVTSISVAGCAVGLPSSSSPTPTPTPTPTSTPTPPADLSSYFNKWFEGGNAIMDRPFTKSTNQRGNDVYKGVARNSSLPQNRGYTTVVELTKSKAEAKQLYDQTVAQKINEGFMSNPSFIATYKAWWPWLTDIWSGLKNGQEFSIRYYYDSEISSWVFITQTGAAS